ncbi:MAG TPA: hypothetical protein VM487_08015 [Phycisphaerae bacterium]|nr:hypothetical protein [Phycisphaerae bacterium]
MGENDWTPQIGLIRGLCTGTVAALGIGGALVAIALLLGPDSAFLSNYFWAELGLVLLGVGFAFAWIVSVICEWAGGLSTPTFLVWAGCLTMLLGGALTATSLSLTDWSAGSFPRVLAASLWVALPTTVGGWAACGIRWRLRNW